MAVGLTTPQLERAPALELRGLAPRVLQPVTLAVASGECVSLGGPSGSGKSLLLRAIADLDPCGGEARVDGRDRNSMPAPEWRRRVTYLAAEPGWWCPRVADHYVDRSAAERLARQLALPADVLGRTVDVLSTGERQRLALIRALVRSPSVLLLDEPTSALDAAIARVVEAVVRDLRIAGVAVVWVTHDEDQARRVATRHFRIHQRAVEEVG